MRKPIAALAPTVEECSLQHPRAGSPPNCWFRRPEPGTPRGWGTVGCFLLGEKKMDRPRATLTSAPRRRIRRAIQFTHCWGGELTELSRTAGHRRWLGLGEREGAKRSSPLQSLPESCRSRTDLLSQHFPGARPVLFGVSNSEDLGAGTSRLAFLKFA